MKRSMFAAPEIEHPCNVAAFFDRWSAKNKRWSAALREFGALGGKVEYWCGLPNCASAIPLTFGLYAPDGTELPCNYRLKDIHAAIEALRDCSHAVRAGIVFA
jgi:hypothetical protein